MGLWEARPGPIGLCNRFALSGRGGPSYKFTVGGPSPGRSILAPAIHVGARAPLLQQLTVRQSTRAGETLAVVLDVAQCGIDHGEAFGVMPGGELVAHA